MSASLPLDACHLADRGPRVQQSPVPHSLPIQVAGARLFHVAESSTAVQLGQPPAPAPSQLYHVPSSSTTPVNVVADAFDISSSGSSSCGGAGYGGGGGPGSLGLPLPAAPTRRMREFIPESKKDDEYWMKRQKNNEAAKRSREKRRSNDAVMMRRIHELAAENKRLKLELDVLRRQLGLIPTTSDSQAPPAAVTASAQLPATEDRAMSRQLTTRYDELVRAPVTPTSYRSSGVVMMVDPVRGEQKQRSQETRLHHHHRSYHASTSAWPTTCCVNVALSTSASDARTFASLPAYCRSSSGTLLPSIGNLCGSIPSQGNGRCVWSAKDDERLTGCRAAPLSDARVDSSPVVIFSDESSCGEDSVDDSLYGRHVDTLTLSRSVERVGDHGLVLESPLNLSTPSRQQSPVFTRHASVSDVSAVVRRSSADSVQLSARWLTVKDESGLTSQPEVVRRYGDDALMTRRASYACESRLLKNGSPEDAQRDQSSRSTSLSSVTSAAWQVGVDVPPHQLASDDVPLQVQSASTDDQLPASGRHVRCGLPLKVRRKLNSASTSSINTEVPRPAYGECSAGVTLARSPLWPDKQRSTSALTPCSVSPEWFRSTSERGRLRQMSDFDVLDQREDHCD